MTAHHPNPFLHRMFEALLDIAYTVLFCNRCGTHSGPSMHQCPHCLHDPPTQPLRHGTDETPGSGIFCLPIEQPPPSASTIAPQHIQALQQFQGQRFGPDAIDLDRIFLPNERPTISTNGNCTQCGAMGKMFHVCTHWNEDGTIDGYNLIMYASDGSDTHHINPRLLAAVMGQGRIIEPLYFPLGSPDSELIRGEDLNKWEQGCMSFIVSEDHVDEMGIAVGQDCDTEAARRIFENFSYILRALGRTNDDDVRYQARNDLSGLGPVPKEKLARLITFLNL